MRNWYKALALIALAIPLNACGRAAPDAGQEAVLTQKPWFFGHGGVDPNPVTTGLTITAFTTDVVYINVQPLTIKEHFEDIMSKDGVPLSFDAYVKVRITDSVKLVQRFGGAYEDVPDPNAGGDAKVPYWYASNLLGPTRNIVRDSVKKRGLQVVAIDYSASGDIEAEVKNAVAAYILKMGLPVEVVDFTLGKANPPDLVLNQRIETAQQEQRQITMVQTKLAEDARKAAEESRAEADNAYRNKMGLSPEQFISLEQIHMQDRVCAKGGCTFINGAELKPMVNVH